MAVEHVTAVLHGLFGVDPSEKLVMLILAEHARRGADYAYPSVPTLARLACLKDRQVQTILGNLVRNHWLSVEVASRGGRSKTNVYRLNTPQV